MTPFQWLTGLLAGPLLKAKKKDPRQMDLFVPRSKGPKPNPPEHRKVVIGMRPPGSGWGPIPGGKRGGFRRRKGNKFEYWYPDKGVTSTPHAADAPRAAKPREAPDRPIFVRQGRKETAGEPIPPQPKTYAEQAANAPRIVVEGPPEPMREQKRTTSIKVEHSHYRTVEQLRERVLQVLGKQKQSLIQWLQIEKVADHPVISAEVNRNGELVRPEKPARTEFRVSIDSSAAIQGHVLLAQVKDGVVNSINHQKSISRLDYERAQSNVCDVCQTKRRRSKVYVLERQADGEHVIVGGECAKKFKGADLGKLVGEIDDVNKALEELETKFREGGEFGVGVAKQYSVRHLVAMGFAAAKITGGYQKGGATAQVADQLITDLERNPDKIKPDARQMMGRATVAVERDWEDIVRWVDDTIAADEKQGRFNDFFVSMKSILDRGETRARDLSRLAWLGYGYYKQKGEQFEKEAREKPAKAYEADIGKLHNLPGEWRVRIVDERESEWGTSHVVIAVRDETGEQIQFKVKLGGWFDDLADRHYRDEELPKLLLRGKKKMDTRNGKRAILTHVSTRLPDKEAKAAADKATADSKARSKRLKELKAAAAKTDFWQMYSLQSLNDEWREDKISTKARQHMIDAWNLSLEQAVNAGDPAAIKELAEGNYGFYELSDKLTKLRNALSAKLYASVFDIAESIENFPQLRARLEQIPVQSSAAKNARSEADVAGREARRKWREAHEAQKNWSSIRNRPLNPDLPPALPDDRPAALGFNLTGMREIVPYDQENELLINPDQRMELQHQLPLDNAIEEISKRAQTERKEWDWVVANVRTAFRDFLTSRITIGDVRQRLSIARGRVDDDHYRQLLDQWGAQLNEAMR